MTSYSRFTQSSIIWCIRLLLDSCRIIYSIVTLIANYSMCPLSCWSISTLSVFQWGLHHVLGLYSSEAKAYFSGKKCISKQLAVLQTPGLKQN